MKAEAHFDRIHVQHDVPTDIDEVRLDGDNGTVWIVRALTETKLCTSNSQARRMIQQGAVSVDGEKLDDIDRQLEKRGEPYTIKVGKRRFVAVRVG
jgi:tyrosyl-tRNA synthetase